MLLHRLIEVMIPKEAATVVSPAQPAPKDFSRHMRQQEGRPNLGHQPIKANEDMVRSTLS